MKGWSRVRLLQRVTVCLSISTVLSVTSVRLGEPNRFVRDAISKEKESVKLDFDAWLGFSVSGVKCLRVQVVRLKQ